MVGSKWEFLDFEPEDKENYRKVFISPADPRAQADNAIELQLSRSILDR